MSNDTNLHWVVSRGGTMGPRSVLMLGERYVGYLYPDPSEGVDVDAAQDEISRRFNVHPRIVEALDAAEKMRAFFNDRVEASDDEERRIADDNIQRLYTIIDEARVAVAKS